MQIEMLLVTSCHRPSNLSVAEDIVSGSIPTDQAMPVGTAHYNAEFVLSSMDEGAAAAILQLGILKEGMSLLRCRIRRAWLLDQKLAPWSWNTFCCWSKWPLSSK